MQKSSATKRLKQSTPRRESLDSQKKEKPAKPTQNKKKFEPYIGKFDDPNL